MNNSTKTTKISAAFLATVLVAGIIAISSPSFMVGAQAVPEYGMDSYKKKSNAKDVSVKNVKCNNINVNVNGLELNTTSVPFLSDLLGSEAQASDEGYSGASSYGSNGGSYGDKKSGSDGDFKFVCINNNNNTVIVGDGDGDGNGALEECESCFDEFRPVFPVTVTLPPLGTITINNLQELCDLIFSPPFSTSAEQLLRLVAAILPTATDEQVEGIVCGCLVPLLGIQGACPTPP
jgi:hypothetical protein